MATPHDEVPGEDIDRDLATLEAAEQELADLERDLSQLEGPEGPPAG